MPAIPEFCPRTISFTIPGNPGVQVTAVENAGKIDFTVDVLNGTAITADLRGLFFHFNESKLGALTITDTDGLITGTEISANNVINLGDGANLNGAASPFDVGIKFGTPGIGSKADDINFPVHFTLSNTGNDLVLDDFAHLQFGARLDSIGGPGGPRGGVSKIVGIAPEAPQAQDESFTMFEDGASGLTVSSKDPVGVTLDVLANDTDSDGDTLSVIEIHDGPAHGSVAIAPDGHSLIYTPDLDYSGPDSFEYCVSDGHGGQDYATAYLSIAAVADLPTLTYQIFAGSTVNEILIDVTATQNDADSSEFLDRIDLGILPAGVTVTPIGGVNPGGEPDQVVQQFLLALPLAQDWNFDFGVTAVSQEVSNGDAETNGVLIPIVLEYNENDYAPTFQATDQSIWSSGSAYTFYDDTFLGIDDGFSESGGSLIGYDVGAHVKAGFQSTLTFTAGDIDANLNYELGIDTHYNKTTDSLLISSSQLLTGGNFTTQGPEGSYKLDFIFNYDFHFALTYDIGVDSGDIVSASDSSNNTYPIINISSADAATTFTFPPPLDSVSLDLAWPHITTTGSSSSPPAGEFTGTGASNNILQLNLDVDQVLSQILLGGVNPFDIGFDIDVVWGNIELADLDIFGGLNILQTFVMQEQGFTGTLHFENGFDQLFIFGSDILLQNALLIDAGGDNDGLVEFNLTLDPQASLQNDTDLGLNIGYSFDLLKVSGGYDIGVDSGSFDFGPVFHAGGVLPVADLGIYDNTFQLDFGAQSFNFGA